MSLPTAVYRLQFRNGMDFDRASRLAPYLAALGVSHLYASPLFTATPGSTHGYDVTNPTEIDPALGGLEGLLSMSRALKAEGLGLILDIVPNHMAFSVETPWLRDVLRHGQASRYARHFDLDLGSRTRLPWLAAPFEEVLSSGGFKVEDDAEGPVLVHGGLRVPLAEGPDLGRARAGDLDGLRAVCASQPWRLTHWRTERDAISHRRFFNITGLIGLRVEDESVFEDVHSLLVDLVSGNVVDGIRVDHIDGLTDPAGYLEKLRNKIGCDVPIWVEKILTGSERLPAAWPIQGTTGYEVARAFSRLLSNPDGLEHIARSYRIATARTDPAASMLWDARRQIMTTELSAELWSLQLQLEAIAAADGLGLEFGREDLREALIAYICAIPRYRTYMTPEVVSESDAALVWGTAEAATVRVADSGALSFLADVLTRVDAETARFRLRMQQVTGAAVAKSQEDTVFYREVRLLSANEVGGEPQDGALEIETFHNEMATRAEIMPHGLTLTSSHDTKRSEDARMRIAAITHNPEAFDAWFRICQGFAPPQLNPNFVWYVAQTFIALEPSDGNFADRLAEHVVKALREAKSESSWTAPNVELEQIAQAYVRRLARHFSRHAIEVEPILEASDRLSLVQTALKLTVPGVPDIYQGCEFADYSLTDPDNRRLVNFVARQAALSSKEAAAQPDLHRMKFSLTHSILRLRRHRPELFLEGAYNAVVAPPGICAFSRQCGSSRLSVAVATTAEADLNSMLLQGDAIWPPEGCESGPLKISYRE